MGCTLEVRIGVVESKPLNLWVMTAEYEPYIKGGLGIVATYLTKELAYMGMQVTVVTMAPMGAVSVAKRDNATIVRLPIHYSAAMIAKFMSRHSLPLPDVIHIHSLQYVPLIKHFKMIANIPVIYTCHSLVLRRGKNRVFTPRRQAHLLRSADHIVVPSGAEHAKLVRKYPFCAAKTTTIAHGVKGSEDNTPDAPKYHLLYAGRLVHRKGLEQLIDALAILKTEYPQAQLYIIGTGTAPYVRELKQRAIRTGVSRAVHWLGKYEHERLQAAYRHYGAVVMPSRSESFGLVALEALAHGVPLTATQAGGLRHFVTSEVAQVIPRADGQSISDAIITMWRSPITTKHRVEAGRVLAGKYQWPHVAVKYAELLTTLRRAE